MEKVSLRAMGDPTPGHSSPRPASGGEISPCAPREPAVIRNDREPRHMQHRLRSSGRRIEVFSAWGCGREEHQPEQHAEDDADGDPDGRAAHARISWQQRECDDIDVAGLDCLGHAGLLEILAQLVTHGRQGIYPAIQPHFLFHHGRQNLDRGAGAVPQVGQGL